MDKEIDIAMHKEHRLWESDIEMWNHDVEMWKEEIKSLKGALIRIEVLIESHEEAVAKHVEDFNEHQSNARVHEQNISMQPEDSGNWEELCELHSSERKSHKYLLSRHNLLKTIQHEFMTAAKEFNDKLEHISSRQD